MAESDRAESESLDDEDVSEQNSVDEQVEKELQKPTESKEGEEERPGPSSHVYTATSLFLKPETENRLITYPLVILRHRTSEKIKYKPTRSDALTYTPYLLKIIYCITFVHIQYPVSYVNDCTYR